MKCSDNPVTILVNRAASSGITITTKTERNFAMQQRSRGFTLIELMIVIAIIGILASLAVSAYQTFTVRAQVAEGLTFVAGAKVPIVDAYTNGGVAPANRAAAGMTPLATDSRGSYVSSVEVNDGRIDVTFGGPLAHQDIIGETLSVTPYETPGNIVIWRCGNASAPAGNLLAGGAGHIPPSLNVRYLPTICR
jgi:type IV pilus assembly protein PilA